MSLIQRYKLIYDYAIRNTLCKLPTEYKTIKQELKTQLFAIGAPHWYTSFQNLHPFIDEVYIRARLIPECYKGYYCQGTLSVERSLLFR